MERVWTEVDGTSMAKKVLWHCIVWSSTGELDYNGRTVLYAQARKYDKGKALLNWVVVFGYKVGDYYQLNGRTAVEVEPVASVDKAAIREKVSPITQGAINFW